MISSKGIDKLLSRIFQEMHTQSSMQGEIGDKKYLIVILCVMRRYRPNHYSTATFSFEKEVHYSHCHEVPQSWPGAILIL